MGGWGGGAVSHAEGGGSTTSFEVILTRELEFLAILKKAQTVSILSGGGGGAGGGGTKIPCLRGGGGGGGKQFQSRDLPIL